MFGYQTPTEIASQIRLEADSRAPRIRLTVISQLLDAGVKPDEVLEKAKEITAWIGENLESLLAEYVEANPVEEEVKGEPEIQADVEWKHEGYL